MGEIDTKCKIKLKHTLKQFPSSVELHSLMKSRPGKKALAPAAFTWANPAAPFSWDVSALGPSRARAPAGARLLPKPWFSSARERKNEPCLRGAAVLHVQPAERCDTMIKHF